MRIIGSAHNLKKDFIDNEMKNKLLKTGIILAYISIQNSSNFTKKKLSLMNRHNQDRVYNSLHLYHNLHLRYKLLGRVTLIQNLT
jgi:hypothetical protein